MEKRTKRPAHKPMTIGSFAKAAGVGIETIRYYQRRGLLDTPGRPTGGKRMYSAEMLGRMASIRAAQSLGFTLAEIESLLALSERDCGSAREMVRAKLLETEARIVELNRARTQLRRYVVMCDRTKPGEPCPFLATLSARESPPAK